MKKGKSPPVSKKEEMVECEGCGQVALRSWSFPWGSS